MGILRTPFCRSASLSLALAAMLFRALLPAGWMPNPVQTHGALLVICTVSGPKHVQVEGAGEHSKQRPAHNNNSGRAETCPFAAASHAVALNGSISIPAAINFTIGGEFLAPHDIAAGTSRFSPHSPRAPPPSSLA